MMNVLFRFFYNLCFGVGFLIASPYFFYRMCRRGNWRSFLGERFGFYSKETRVKLKNLQQPLWIHAVSVGEMMLARALVHEIRKLRPQQAIVLTTTTVTGRRVGQSLVDEHTHLLYTPIDFFWIVRRAYQAMGPAALILVEAEIWPNYLWQAAQRKVPVYLINARLSDRSLPRYQQMRFLTKHLLGLIGWVALQHASDRARFARAGYPSYKLFVVGSMKFDVAGDAQYDKQLAPKLRSSLQWDADDLVLLAGSTHRGEERMLVDIFKKLRSRYPALKLVLVPRHAERAQEVLAECKEFSVVLRSQLDTPCASPADMMILDTTGELKSLYPLGTINFIGKSLVGYGGQNFIEATRFGQPVIFGPHMENFSSLVALFLEKKAVVQVQTPQELEAALLELFQNPDQRERIGQRAALLFQENTGAAARTAKMIVAGLSQ